MMNTGRCWRSEADRLESCGFTIIGEEENGERALLTLEQEQPELVISDIRMPGMDGLALLRLLREKRRKRKCCS